MNLETIKITALKELRDEEFREAVEIYKTKLKAAKWWHKLLPYKVVLIKRESL